MEHPGIDRLIDRVERERVAARAEMERYLRQLLDGPLQREIERRFGTTEAATNGSGALGWKRIMSRAWPVDDVDPERRSLRTRGASWRFGSPSSIPLSRSSRIRNSPRHCTTCGSQRSVCATPWSCFDRSSGKLVSGRSSG